VTTISGYARILFCLLPGLYGCLITETALNAKVGEFNNKLDEAEKRHNKDIQQLREEMKSGVGKALCPSDVYSVILEVAKRCRPGVACVDPSIVKVIQTETRGGRFQPLMSSQKHKLFFLTNGGKLSEQEALDLKLFIKPPWLVSTHFLVVSHPDEKEASNLVEAQKRGRVIIEKMLQIRYPEEAPDAKIDEAQQVLHWVFPFTVERAPLRTEDLPVPPADIRARKDLSAAWQKAQLSRSVWVFRVDC